MENQEKTMDFIRKSLLSEHKHHSDYEIKSLNQRTIIKDKIESLSILPINKTTFSFKNIQYNSYNTHINELYIINKVFLKKLMIYFCYLEKVYMIIIIRISILILMITTVMITVFES